MDDLKEKARERIRKELERHPGDAPWSCVECYHSRPCIEKVMLLAAQKELGD
jgi:hypothetical protein